MVTKRFGRFQSMRRLCLPEAVHLEFPDGPRTSASTGEINFAYNSTFSTSATDQAASVGQEGGYDAEHGVTEAADVQYVATILGLGSRVRLEVDAGPASGLQNPSFPFRGI